jgi:hypothetical protein
VRHVRTFVVSFLIFFSAAAQASAAVVVSPAAGVTTASPKTQISFLGVPAARIGSVTVTGAHSGRHSGVVRGYSDGSGASFEPSKAFTPGEKVTVHQAAAGTWSFVVARTARQPPIRKQPASSVGNGTVQKLLTEPSLLPATVDVTTSKPGTAPGDVFLTPAGGRGQEGEMILGPDGKMVWFKPVPTGDISTDLRVQTYQGKPVLTWWQGGLIVGDGRGEGEIFDTSYKPVATVRAGNGLSTDLHELQLTARGTALLISYLRVPHGTGSVVDNIIQEVDIKTGLVEWEWHSIGHIALGESEVPPPPQRGAEWDYMHMNAVSEMANGDLLVSARNTWGVYEVSRTTGAVVWRLGGKKPSFKMGAGTKFAFQHDARQAPDGSITIFDDEAAPPQAKHSRAIRIAIDPAAKTATLMTAFQHPLGLLTATQGSSQLLGNGDTFVGWGSQRYFSEFSPSGQLLFDGHLATGNASYRAYRLPWSATPATAPKAVATLSGGKVTATASWNGATEVASWQLLAGPDASSMTVVAAGPRMGFESSVTAATTQPMVAMRALDATGTTLATSAAVKVAPTG